MLFNLWAKVIAFSILALPGCAPSDDDDWMILMMMMMMMMMMMVVVATKRKWTRSRVRCQVDVFPSPQLQTQKSSIIVKKN